MAFLRLLLLLPLLALPGLAGRKPNVLVLFIDDMGYADPSCFGNPLVETPHIDSLATDGLKLTNFYVNSPICSASRTALATGQYQQRWRIHSFLASRKAQKNRKMANWLDPEAIHTAQVFKDAGYATAHFGKWHLGGGRDVDDAPLPTEYGFDESYVSFEGLGDRLIFPESAAGDASIRIGRGKIDKAPKRETSRIYTDKALDFISRHKERPFYLEWFPNDVHDGFFPTREATANFAAVTDNPEERKFLAVLTEMDRQIGRLLAHLEDEELAKDTIVIFTSDNGPTDWPRYYEQGLEPPGFTGPFFGRKWSLYEGGIRMPFLVRWPGRIESGATDDQSIVAAFDLQPTLAKLAGIPTPDGKTYDGEDRSSVLLGKPGERAEPIFWEYGVFGSIQPGKKEHRSPSLAMRDGDWKLLCNPNGSSLRLHHLIKDPGEKHNLATEHPDQASDMRKRLLAWWQRMKTRP